MKHDFPMLSNTNHGRLDLGRADKRVLVGNVGLGDGTLGGIVGGAAEVDIVDRDASGLLGVLGDESLLSVAESRRLNKNLSTHARVDTSDADVLVVVVEDVDGTEADRGSTRANVGPVVVGVGDVESTSVLSSVAVGVADKRSLMVVVETIKEVLVLGEVGGQLAVVDPDVGGLLDADGVAVGSDNVLDGQVADDDVLLLVDVEADVLERSTSGTDDGLVGLDTDLVVTGELALDVNDLLLVRLGGLAELSKGRNSHGSSSGTTSGTSILGSIANVGSIGDGSSLAESLANLLDGRSRNGAGQSSEFEETEELHLGGVCKVK
ncbi:hypothetical protein HG531_008630 [Fusarium graminearum]|nr:hypothetical protein HG531_008630 [Fusarium graminearum]